MCLFFFCFFLCNAGAPGLIDPCEKNPTDTLATMEEQQREDITSSAQVMYTLTTLKSVFDNCASMHAVFMASY